MRKPLDEISVQSWSKSAATMKLLLLTTGLMYVAFAFPNTEWTQFKEKYQKVYTSEQEDLMRYNEYLKTKKMVEEHNMRFEKGETTYWMEVNHFSDWFAEEIDRMLGRRPNETTSNEEPFELPAGKPVPKSINWVTKGAVTGVKKQGNCNSGYAFSAVGSLEGLMFTTNNTITDISAQELLDCTSFGGCNGGLEKSCFEYVAMRNGIDTDASYPYKGVRQHCLASNGVIGTTCTLCRVLHKERSLKEAVGTVGPVSIAFAVSKPFLAYKGGIFDGDCGNYQNHGMLAVGYDRDKRTGTNYWLIKNSWGKKWGEKGFARVIRNVNKCQIGNMASYPIYKD